MTLGAFMRCRALALLGALLTSSLAGWGVTPQFWENLTQDDLLKG